MLVFILNAGSSSLKYQLMNPLTKDNYAGIEFEDNQYGSTAELIAKTIEYLNLNCDRLTSDRIAVFHEYERLLKKARADKKTPNDFLDKLAKHWFQKQWLPFFTTRRSLLGNHSENYLTNTTPADNYETKLNIPAWMLESSHRDVNRHHP